MIQKGTEPDHYHFCDLHFDQEIGGNFDIQASFRDLKTVKPAEEKHSGVAIHIGLDRKPIRSIDFYSRCDQDGHTLLEPQIERIRTDNTSRWDTEKLYHEITAGTLRVARRGDTIHYLFANGDSQQFRLYRIADRDGGSNPAESSAIPCHRCRNQRSTGRVDESGHSSRPIPGRRYRELNGVAD